MNKILLVLILTVCLMVFMSCSGIQEDSLQNSTRHPTLGQEMIDLMKARDQGAISNQEYRELKELLKQSYV